MASDPFAVVANDLMNYVNNDSETELNTVRGILSKGFPYDIITSVFWTFLKIMRDEKKIERMISFGSVLMDQCSSVIPYFFLTLDQTDLDALGVGEIDMKKWKLLFRKYYSQTLPVHYKFFNQNPEGYSRLLPTIYQGNVDDFLQIMGMHKLDPTSVLALVFDVFDMNVSNGPLKILQSLPLDSVLNYLLYLMKKKFTPSLAHIISYFYESGIITKSMILSIFKNKREAFDGFYNYVLTKAKEFCVQKTRPVIRFGTETKEDNYDANFKKARSNYRKAEQIWSNFPLFTMLNDMDDESFLHAIRILKDYDPCQIGFIFERTLSMFRKSVEEGAIDYELMLFVGGHVCDTDLVFALLEIEDLPPCAFSHFLLPAIALSDMPWQISIPIFDVIKDRFTYSQRYEIYSQFANMQNSCIDQMFVIAEAKRKISYTLRRLSNGRGKELSGKYSRIALRAPVEAVNSIIEFISDKSYTTNTKQSLSYIVNYFSPLSLDQLIWVFVQSMDNKSFNSKDENFNEWPVDYTKFVATTFTEHYDVMDINGFIKIIANGIAANNTVYICMFSKLVESMCNVSYAGNLTDRQFEKCCAYKYSTVARKARENDKDHDSNKSKIMKNALHIDDIGIQIIANLDLMKKKLPSMPCKSSLADMLDQIQFTIIESCDPLDLHSLNVSPNKLVIENGLSLSCAFHLSRASCTIENASELAPEDINSQLFGLFWTLTQKAFHIPKEFLEGKKKKLNTKISKSASGLKPTLELAVGILDKNLAEQENKRNEYRQLIKEKGGEWFQKPEDYWAFVKHCIIPRTKFSELDASYCELFVNELIHYVPTLDHNEMLNAILCKLHFIIISSTLEEMRSFGKFISRLMDDLEFMDEKNFLHEKFLEKVSLALDRTELMTLINVIELLSYVQSYFPDDVAHFEALDAKLNKIEETINEQPQNLKTKFERYRTILGRKREEFDQKIQKDEQVIKEMEENKAKAKAANSSPPRSKDRRSRDYDRK